jgi:putative FmdB family regulatory protein
MPIYEYQAVSSRHSCPYCRNPFERLRRLSDPPLTHCPACGSEIRKLISAPAVGGSKSSLDDRAKSAGFHKLKKLGKGEYEKEY